MKRSKELGTIALEAVAVVASILVAFALDAWWDRREERDRLDAELRGVAEEIAVNQDRVAYQLDLINRVMAGGDAFVAAAEATEGGTIEVADTLAWLAFGTAPTLDMSLGAVDAIIQSGNLRSIRDRALRTRLAGLRDQMGDVREEQLVVREFRLRIGEYLEGTGWVKVSTAIAREFWAQPRIPGQPIPGRGPVVIAFDPKLLDMVRERNAWFAVALGELEVLRGELEAIQDVISAERGSR